jgi:glycine cleavage system H protein
MHFPQDLLYTKDHEWVRIEGNSATVGVTDFAQEQLGDIIYVEIESLGESIEQTGLFGTVEAVKTVSDLFMPVSGTITEVNELLKEQPEIVNQDPYGKGWMVRISLEGDPQTGELMNAEEYEKMI